MATSTCLFLLILLNITVLSVADTYNVKIVTDQYLNVVDSRFLSFTIDPKYLFETSEKYSSKECICMASSLTPAYLRIAGPSTAHMSFLNTTFSINEVDYDLAENEVQVFALDADMPKNMDYMAKKLAVSHREWRKFVHWAKSTGFDLVFALNNEERTASNMWDPNTALNILTVAEKTMIGDMFWELGYECTNQSIEEYLNDLETLRVIIETFPPGRTGEWKVVGGDVTKCLQADSKSDFKDYITLSNDMMDALLLNGNSSTHELDRMSEMDHLKLLRLLAHSRTPLWLTEKNQRKYNQLERAADWLSSLGYSATRGFSVHYRELEEEEMYEPTLSYYMALLFKNLVGERVLNVSMEPEQAILFGHCTSLRHKPVPGAVTLYGVNMDDEPARFSLRLSKREDGGDVMQYILGHDHSGNIVVNGRAMYYEGDIRPVVKRVRPYKTLLINLPPKSFGFWVLANTKIEACQEIDQETQNMVKSDPVTEKRVIKRSVDEDFDDYNQIANLTYDFEDYDTVTTNNALKNRIVGINKDLEKLHSFFQSNRVKRDESFIRRTMRRQGIRPKVKKLIDVDPKEFLGNILEKAKQSVFSIKNKGLKEVKRRLHVVTNKVNKRHSGNSKIKANRIPLKYTKRTTVEKRPKKRYSTNKVLKKKTDMPEKFNMKSKYEVAEKSNKRNSNEKVNNSKQEKITKQETKNEIIKEDTPIFEPKSRKRREVEKELEGFDEDLNSKEKQNLKAKIWKYFKDMHYNIDDFTKEKTSDSQEDIILRTELSDDTATIKVTDSGKGIIKSTMKKLATVLEELNKNVNRVLGGISLLD